jgi:hypothetical protein
MAAAYGDGMFFFTRPVGAPDAISEGEYGDGMFFFTQPVGAPEGEEPSYGDGMFFFTQPVGAPNGAATVPNGAPMSYGAAKPSAALTLKPGAATLKSADPRKSKGVTTKYVDVSSSDLAAFQKAAGDLGVRNFWADFWAMRGATPLSVTRPTAATGGSREASSAPASVSSTSKSLASTDATKVTAAKTALDAAKKKILSGVPNATSTSAVAKALDVYAAGFSAQGWYAQAFRNVSGSDRKASSVTIDAIRRDAMDPYVKGTLSLTSATKIAQGYIRSDVESYYGDATAWKIEEPTTKNKKLKYGMVPAEKIGPQVVGWLITTFAWSANFIASIWSDTKGWNQDLIVKDGNKKLYFLKQSDAETYRTYLKQRDFRNAVMTSAFNSEISKLRSSQVSSRDKNNGALGKLSQAFLDARKKAFDDQIAFEQAEADKQSAATTARARLAEAEKYVASIRAAATTARDQRTAAETAASVTYDADAASTAASAANTAASEAESGLSRVRTAADAVKTAAANAGGLADAQKASAETAYTDAESAASDARADADLASGQAIIAAANRKAADDKAAADAAAAEATAAEAAAAAAAAQVASGQTSQAEADALKAKADAERAEANALAGVAAASEANAQKILEANTPADRRTLEGTPGMKKVGFLAGGAGEESFVSKNKLWIGLGAVAAIGGGYWWYTQKYLPSKAGR